MVDRDQGEEVRRGLDRCDVRRDLRRCFATAPALGRERGGHALEGLPHLEDLAYVSDVDLAHHHAAARDDDHQPLLRQTLERLMDGRAAEGGEIAERLLDQDLAGSQAEGDDLLEERPVGLLRQ